MANEQLHNAKNAKQDEFYTTYEDIEAELNAYYEHNKNVFRNKTILCPCDDPGQSNFTKYFLARFDDFGIKSLISTSYANSYLSQFPPEKEKAMACYDEEKQKTNGRIYRIDDVNKIPHNLDEIEWSYLNGDGDFRSKEVTALRDEADMIVSNGPFSLFREFLAWIIEGKKEFSIIGNINAVTYKEVFPLIKDNAIWLGASIHSGDRKFFVPDSYPLNASGCGIDEDGKKFIRVKGVRWFTNIDHDIRHEPLPLMTLEDNLKYNKKLCKKLENDYGKLEYPHYDNYDAIEVPFTEAIPSDYVPCWFNCDKAILCPYAQQKGLSDAVALCEETCNGNIGVPITFLDKHNPEQFEIVKFRKGNDDKDLVYSKINNEEKFTECSNKKKRERRTTVQPYFRIVIRQKKM